MKISAWNNLEKYYLINKNNKRKPNDFEFGYHDLILTILDNNPIQINGKLVELMDDPFIISKPNILGSCINYCKNRTDLKYDGEIYTHTQELKIHKTEPIGPFGLTEWLYKNNIKG